MPRKPIQIAAQQALCQRRGLMPGQRAQERLSMCGTGKLRRRGMLLVESALSLSILTVLGLTLLKLSLNILAPRQWTLQQSLSDAYLTYERAYAQRIPFEDLVGTTSPWPAYPSNTSAQVEVGRLPGNQPIYGTVVRTRLPDSDNYPIDGGTGTVATNPAAMKTWRVQSVLTYRVGSRNYVKARTVLRSQ